MSAPRYEQVVAQFEKKKNLHLIYSLILDALGMATYIIPFLGELGDIIYAPLYGIAIFAMYRLRAVAAMIGGGVGFIEEIIPGADIIPTATAMWVYMYVMNRSSSLERFVTQKSKDKAIVEKLS